MRIRRQWRPTDMATQFIGRDSTYMCWLNKQAHILKSNRENSMSEGRYVCVSDDLLLYGFSGFAANQWPSASTPENQE